MAASFTSPAIMAMAVPELRADIDTTDVKALSEALLAKEYKHAKPGCNKTEWKTIETSIIDPFGNTLTFAERLSEREKEA
jgi:hypothetical protein